ncbi:O-antigen ligase family protein [bacterium]|nr:O-antigen ligase family protein [bacterium]
MEFLIIIALVAALVWVMVALKFSTVFTRRFSLVPVLGFLVILLGCVFGYDFFHVPGGPIPITLDRLMLAGVTGAFVWQFAHGRQSLRRFNSIDWGVMMLTVVITLSTLMGDFTFLGNMPASRLLFFNLFPVALYMVMRHAQISDNDLKLISLGFVVMGLYLAVTAIAETRGLGSMVFPRYIMNPEFEEFFGRGRGPFLNPVSNGVCMVLCLCCMWMWFPGSSLRRKALIVGLACLMCLGIYSTLTRSVWMGLVFAAAIVVFMPASKSHKGAMMIVASLLLMFLAPVLADKVFSFKRDKEVSVADMENSAKLRPMFVTVAKRMVVDRPFLGVGFGQYARAKYPYLQDPSSAEPLSMTRGYMQHNIFLAYVTETGFLGLGALVLMLSLFLRAAWTVWRDTRLSFWQRQFGLLMMAMIANHCVNGMFHDVSIIPMENMFLFFLAAVVNNFYSTRPEQAPYGYPVEPVRREHSQIAQPSSGSMVT